MLLLYVKLPIITSIRNFISRWDASLNCVYINLKQYCGYSREKNHRRGCSKGVKLILVFKCNKKVITPSNHKDSNKRNEPIRISRKLFKAREKSRVWGVIGFGLFLIR